MRDDEAHLLRSPANAARLLAALESARNRTGVPVSMHDLLAMVTGVRWAYRGGLLRRFQGRRERPWHWFNHPEMQARIAEAEADIREGRTYTCSAEEYLALLESWKDEDNE